MTDPIITTQALCIAQIIHICFNNQRNYPVNHYSLMLLQNEIKWRLKTCRLDHIKFEVLSHNDWYYKHISRLTHPIECYGDDGTVHIDFEDKLLQEEVEKYYDEDDIISDNDNQEMSENEYIEHLKKYDPYRWNESQNNLMNKLRKDIENDSAN